jgi:hypothetical protein
MTDPAKKIRARKQWVRGPGPRTKTIWLWVGLCLINAGGHLWAAIETGTAGSLDTRALAFLTPSSRA